MVSRVAVNVGCEEGHEEGCRATVVGGFGDGGLRVSEGKCKIDICN